MKDAYISVEGLCRTEKTIEKSRFITTSFHVEGDKEAGAFVSRVSGEFPDATHSCFAYIADDGAQLLRFSDAGEPSGTAGMPILEVIKNKGLVYTAVVVTRYFGGVKLGAGGLVRAYAGCAAENLSAAKVTRYALYEDVETVTDYAEFSAATKFIDCFGARDVKVEYLGKVKINLRVRAGLSAAFVSGMTSALSGSGETKTLGTKTYLPET
ncbi:MAG: YigZ family protein [Clostridia bacterium]|nr:YigZ family protein [Clostridia bacterium]